MRFARHRFLAITALVATGCGDNTAIEPDAAVDAAIVGQGSEARGDFIINEVSPRGDGPDWVELHNRGDAPIDRCDFFLTDAVDRLDHYLPLGGAAVPDPCEPLLLEPGAYLIVTADDAADGSGTQAPFRLGVADEVHIVNLEGVAVDSLVYLHDEPSSLARQPSGSGLFFPAEPSPGEVNP